jgi:Rod binding domain-containing protein
MSAPNLRIASESSGASKTLAKVDRSTPPPTQEASREVKEASAAFEAILVRQMLTSASVAGKGSYSDMGVEAVATAISSGGGLGLGRAIQQALGQSHPTLADHPRANDSTSATAPSVEAAK